MQITPAASPKHLVFLFVCVFAVGMVGCKQKQSQPPTPDQAAGPAASDEQDTLPAAQSSPAASAQQPEEPIALPEAIELRAEPLLAAQLPTEQLEQGWVRLFDGQSLYGWFMVGNADWHIAEDGIIRVTRGERSYLCTSFQIPNFEFQVDFRSEAETNSGVFLRTGPEPLDVATASLELNIAPPDNPFPTGSFVERKKLEPEDLGDFDPTEWHTFNVRLVDKTVEVSLDGKPVMRLDDFESSPTGHISLQHNSGQVEFRNVLLRPVGLTELKLTEDWESDWTLSEKEEGTFTATVVDNGLQLKGGLGQLQSKRDFGDFFLQASYTLSKPEVNSGIFFRCVRDNMLDGYECQVNHAVVDGDPLRPADAGAGAIFRRQPARIVVGDGTKPTHLTLLADGQQMVTWVNGLQVAEFYDSREPNENPRQGMRTEPGPVALQGHDATTEVIFHSLRIGDL